MVNEAGYLAEVVYDLVCSHCHFCIPLTMTISSRVGHASKVPSDAIRMNLNIVRNQTFDTADLDKLVARSVSSFVLGVSV